MDLKLYKFSKILGKGSFAQVTQWTLKDSEIGKMTTEVPRVIAIKTFTKYDDETDDTMFEMIREMSILRKIGKHEHIVHVLGNDGLRSIFLEHMEWTLRELIATRKNNIKDANRIYLMIADGLQYIHDNGFIHCDLKPANILCTDCDDLTKCKIKIADFGISIRYIHKVRKITDVGTIWYKAPEIILGDQFFTKSIDIYSLGLIFAQLLGMPRFLIAGANDADQISKIFTISGIPNDKTWKDAQKLPNYEKYCKKFKDLSFEYNLDANIIFATFEPSLLRNLLEKGILHEDEKHITSIQAAQRQITAFKDNEEIAFTKKILCSTLALDPIRRHLVLHFSNDYESMTVQDISNVIDGDNPLVKGFTDGHEINIVETWDDYIEYRLKFLNSILANTTNKMCLSTHTFQAFVILLDQYFAIRKRNNKKNKKGRCAM